MKLTAEPFKDVAEPSFKAMVIDDAYDDVISETEITLEEFQTFLSDFNQTNELDELFETHNVEMLDLSNLNDRSPEFLQLINRLWKLRNEEESSHQYLNILFHVRLDKRDDLEAVCANLIAHQFDVVRKDSKTDKFDEVKSGHFKIVLLDYNLGPDGEEAVKNARKKAIDIYNLCDENKKPLMVLMSSYADVKDKVEKFRIDASLGNVIFRFAPKENLKNISTASLLVSILKSETEQVHKLQRYISTLKLSASNALKAFYEDVDALTIDDYVFIHDSTVPSQGHPFGDYLNWLYGAHWTNLLSRNPNLKADQDALDFLLNKKPSLQYSMPSPKVVEIYMSALFEEGLGEIQEFHPLSGQKIGNSVLAKLPYLHLGDIFHYKGDNTIWMILNPQCDLERADESTGEQSIFLVPGSLHLLDAKKDLPNPKTELIIIANKQYRVVWHLKTIKSVPLKDFNEWRKKNCMERKFRLRLPYALEVQHAFTSAVGRVGLPVSPPLLHQVRVEVLIKIGKSSMNELLKTKDNYAFLAVTRKADKKIRFTLDFALDLKLELENKKIEITERKTAKEKVEEDQSLIEFEAKIDNILEKFDEWFMNNYYIDLPGNSIKGTLQGYIGIVEGYKKDMDVSKFLLLINILPIEADNLPNK